MERYTCSAYLKCCVLFFALFVVPASTVSAGCGPPPNNGWGSGYPAYAAWCIQCGGRPYNDRGVGCDMSNASTGGSGSYTAPPAGGMRGAVLQGIQRGLQQGQQNAIEQQRRQQQENNRATQQMLQDNAALQENAHEQARIIEERNRNAADKAQQSESQRTADIMSQMKGVSGTSGIDATKDLSNLPGSDTSCVRETDFNDYLKQASERKAVLAKLNGYKTTSNRMKARVDWCKMHIPLPPSPSSAEYCSQKQVYEDRMNTWKTRCAVATDVAPPQRQQNVVSAKNGERSAEPDCLGIYDREAKNCTHDNLTVYASCINSALANYTKCINAANPDMGTPTR
jgi:hypothetical protein